MKPQPRASYSANLDPELNHGLDKLFKLFSKLSQQLESYFPNVNPSHSRFAPAKSNEEVASARTDVIPKKTREDTKYCVRIWDSWSEFQSGSTSCVIKPSVELSNSELQYWLTRFVLEVRKKDGTDYPANSLHHTYVLQHHETPQVERRP